jgi:hypothetical protein
MAVAVTPIVAPASLGVDPPVSVTSASTLA